MSTNTTAAPTAAIRERWESESLVTPWEDVLSCMEGDLPVTVCVLPVPTEGWELTLDDV